jgi:hypothetical protein
MTSVWLRTSVASDRGEGRNNAFMARARGSVAPPRWRVARCVAPGGDGTLTSGPSTKREKLTAGSRVIDNS